LKVRKKDPEFKKAVISPERMELQLRRKNVPRGKVKKKMRKIKEAGQDPLERHPCGQHREQSAESEKLRGVNCTERVERCLG
jgi:hypothetical protein